MAVVPASFWQLKKFFLEVKGAKGQIKRFIPLFFGLIIIQSVFSPSGTALLAIKDVPLLTSGGVTRGISVILRMFIIISSALILTTSSYQEIIAGLIKMKVPYEIAFMVLLAIRFLPVLMEEFTDAITAIQLRGVRIDRIPFGEKVKIYTYNLMPVVAGSVLKAKKVAVSMETRAFRAYPTRTYIQEINITAKDYLVIFLSLIAGLLSYILYLNMGF